MVQKIQVQQNNLLPTAFKLHVCDKIDMAKIWEYFLARVVSVTSVDTGFKQIIKVTPLFPPSGTS